MKKISDRAFSLAINRDESFIFQMRKRKGGEELAEWLHSVGADGYLSLEKKAQDRLLNLWETSSIHGNNFAKEFGEKADNYRKIVRNIRKNGRMKTETVKELAEYWKIGVEK